MCKVSKWYLKVKLTWTTNQYVIMLQLLEHSEQRESHQLIILSPKIPNLLPIVAEYDGTYLAVTVVCSSLHPLQEISPLSLQGTSTASPSSPLETSH